MQKLENEKEIQKTISIMRAQSVSAQMSVTYSAGLIRAGGTRKAPKVMLGYHGTPSRNTDAIMKNGFCPKCRRSAGDGRIRPFIHPKPKP